MDTQLREASRSSVLIVGVGAARGLGAAVARRFARGGHPVAIAGRNAQKLEATARELRDAGAIVTYIVGDAGRAEDAKHFVAQAEQLAPLAVAVHNAGGNEAAPFLQVSEESFTRHWREHALGGFQLAQAAIPVLVAHGGGSLFFTGASARLRGRANFAPFASAKAALRNLAQSIAREYGPQMGHASPEPQRLDARVGRPSLERKLLSSLHLLTYVGATCAYWVSSHFRIFETASS